MDDPVTWIIVIGFYAPLHYLVPQLVAFLTGNDSPEERKRLRRALLIECTVVMVLAFGLAIWLVHSSPQLAMLILLASLFSSYLFIAIWRRLRRRALSPVDTSDS
ncbi:MAG: hypothetical protein KDH88_03785 [Chromatiales bacterium]|nr:hypothetical protein [Chromatiales bacterium]